MRPLICFITKARYLCDRHWYSRGGAQLFSYIAIYFIGWAKMWLRYIQGHFHFLIYHIWRQKGPLQINHFQLNITDCYMNRSFLYIGYWKIPRSFELKLCFHISGKACICDDDKIKMHEFFSRLVATDHMHHKCAVTAIFPPELMMLKLSDVLMASQDVPEIKLLHSLYSAALVWGSGHDILVPHVLKITKKNKKKSFMNVPWQQYSHLRSSGGVTSRWRCDGVTRCARD